MSSSQSTSQPSQSSSQQAGSSHDVVVAGAGSGLPEHRDWFLRSPFFDAQIMSPRTLRQLQNAQRYVDGPLHVLQRAQDRVSFRSFSSLTEPENRKTTAAHLHSADTDVTILFLQHIFEHTSPDGLDPRQRGIMRFSIGLSAETFAWLMAEMQVHPLLIEALHSHVGQMVVDEAYDSSTDPEKYLHLIVKVPPAGHLEAAFYIRYSYLTRKVLAIVAGNDLQNHAEQLQEHLTITNAPCDPFALATAIISQYFLFLEAQKIQVDHAVIMTERETGRGAVAYSDGETTHAISPDKFDLTFMHWIEGNQRNIVFAAEFQLRLARWLIDEHMQFVQQRTATHFERHRLSRSETAVHDRLRSHEQQARGLHNSSLVVRERIQRQLSAADSIINQYDNKVSLKNAEANTNIAMQSTRIADDSRKIAAETRRDSTSMKTIASLTMVYLPGTFAASVFSTGFFSYQTDDGGIKVNRHIWTLFAVAAVLSMVTIGSWIWLNKFGIPKLLNWARQEQGDGEEELSSRQRGKGPVLPNFTIERQPLEIVSVPRVGLPAGPPGNTV